MELIIHTALSFPLIVFTVLLGLLALYWLLVAIGLLRIEFFEHDSLRDDHLSSTLVSLGLGGVPASVALTVLLLFASLIGLAIDTLVLRFIPLGIWRIPLGFVLLWVALTIAAPLSVAACHTLQRNLHRFRAASTRSLLGQAVVTKGPSDHDGLCQATLEDDPSILVTLHSKAHCRCARAGERRVLVKYIAGESAYRSVPQDEYLDAHTRLRKLHLLHRHSGSHTAH